MLISVIIPVYNRYSIVKDAVESILLQRHYLRELDASLEVIIVNDGSSCDYEAFLSAYKYSGTHINIISLSSNLGVSSARNKGLSFSNGDFVAFLDSDDLFLPHKLFQQISFMQKNNIHISHTDEFWFRKDKGFVNKNNANLYSDEKFYFDKCRVSPSSLVITRKFICDFLSSYPFFFDPNLRVCEDYEFVLRANILFDIWYLDKKLIIKRAITENSLSANIKHIESIRLEILSSFFEKYSHLLDAKKRDAIFYELDRKMKIVKNR